MDNRLQQSGRKAQQHALNLAVVSSGAPTPSGSSLAPAARGPSARAARAGPVIVKARNLYNRRPTAHALASAIKKPTRGPAPAITKPLGRARQPPSASPVAGAKPTRGPKPATTKPLRRGRQPPSASPMAGGNSKAGKDVADYVDTHRREVGRFGSQGLDKRDKRAYQTAQLVKLGCKPPKNPKMPIGLLQRVRQRQSQRQQEKKEMDIATGMLVRSRRKR